GLARVVEALRVEALRVGVAVLLLDLDRLSEQLLGLLELARPGDHPGELEQCLAIGWVLGAEVFAGDVERLAERGLCLVPLLSGLERPGPLVELQPAQPRRGELGGLRVLASLGEILPPVLRPGRLGRGARARGRRALGRDGQRRRREGWRRL